MAKYADYSIKQIEENSGSLGRIPLIFFQPSVISIKNNIVYNLTVDTKDKI